MRKYGDFIRGMDISSYMEMKDRGFKYYDYEGKETDILPFAKKQGFNFVRLRIWNEPQNVPESGGYCDKEKTVIMAKRVKEEGLGLFLDFHYSDWWADPGHQKKPKAWEKLNLSQLQLAVYEYTKDVLEELKRQEIVPELVQIGNEIRTGMLFPEGEVKNWKGLSKLLNSGIRGVREVFGRNQTRIVLHLDQGGRYHYYEEWFDKALEYGVTDFDVIGLSYYPFWHGEFYDFKSTMERLVKRYGKDLIVAETAHAYQKSRDDFFGEQQEAAAGFAASPEDQKKVLELIENIIWHISDEKGLGFFYWEPFMRASKDEGGWGSCMSLVDDDGKPLEALKAISYEAFEEDRNKVAKIYPIEGGELFEKNSIEDAHIHSLPSTVKALYMDGRLVIRKIIWDEIEKCMNNEYIAKGKIEGLSETVTMKIPIPSPLENSLNYLENGNFEQGTKGWKVLIWEGCGEVKTKIEKEENTMFGSSFYFEMIENGRMSIMSKTGQLPKGKYRLSCLYRGENTTGVQIILIGKAKNEASVAIFPQDTLWKRYETDLIDVEEEQNIEVSLEVTAPSIRGKVANFRVEKEEIENQ